MPVKLTLRRFDLQLINALFGVIGNLVTSALENEKGTAYREIEARVTTKMCILTFFGLLVVLLVKDGVDLTWWIGAP